MKDGWRLKVGKKTVGGDEAAPGKEDKRREDGDRKWENREEE